MAIDALYKNYFQKSKVLWYPHLGIKRGAVAVPEQTYLSWENKISTEDAKYVTLYPERNDAAYITFEKNVLLSHKRLSDCIKLNNGQKLFIFDFSDLKSDWIKFISGKYSQMNVQLRRRVRDHFDKNTSTYVYVNSYMFPEQYFSLYAELLGTSEDILRSVGELCSKPDLEKETLTVDVENLQNKKILG
jgi:hypothetical protein